MTPTTELVEVAGGRLEILDRPGDRAAGPPILLLHEGLGR